MNFSRYYRNSGKFIYGFDPNIIIIGKFAGKDNAFLIQNAFPILAKYFDHVYTTENKAITIHKKLDRELTINLRKVLAMYRKGIHLIFPDIEKIQKRMEQELYDKKWTEE